MKIDSAVRQAAARLFSARREVCSVRRADLMNP